MSTPPPLSALADPTALAKLQILLVPVHDASSADQGLSNAIYKHWASLIRRHVSVRSDEIPSPIASTTHNRGGFAGHPRARFYPATSATSVSRGNTNQHIHINYSSSPPAKHLAPFSLLRLTTFPLVVIGISAAPDVEAPRHVRGFSVDSEEDGDIGEASTPRAAKFKMPEPTVDPMQSLDSSLQTLFPPSSPFPLVKRLVMVPSTLPSPNALHSSPRKGVPNGADKGKGKSREEVQYAPLEGSDGWVGRLMAEVVGEVLGELGELATSLETPNGLQTLASTLLPSLTATLPPPTHSLLPVRSATPTDINRSNSATPTFSHGPSLDALNGAGSTGSGLGVKRSLTPGGRPTSIRANSVTPINTVIAPEPRPPSSSNPFRRSTALSSPFTRTSSAASITSNSSAGGAQSPIVAQRYTSASLAGVSGGRLMKLLGDFYLLTGLYGDAIKCYDDGAERCRVAGDPLWEGVAREGRAVAGIGEAWEARDGSDRVQSFSSSPIPVEILAHYLSALSCISKAPLPFPPTILSPSPQAVSGSLTLPAPSAPGSAQLGTGEGLLAYLYTSLSLRIAHFQFITWAAGGWGSIALSCLINHTLPRSYPIPPDLFGQGSTPDAYTRRRRHRFLALLTSKSGLTRSSIFAHGEGAIGPHHRGMTKPEQLAVYTELVWLARYLDLPRHEAMLAREAARKVGLMVVEGREEARRIARAGFGRKDVGAGDTSASVGLGLGMSVSATKGAGVAVRRKESSEGNAGVVRLLERAFEVLGIEALGQLPRDTRDTPAPNSSTSDVKTHFGWPELQVDTLQSAIKIAEGMADHATIARFCFSALKGLTLYLNPSSQMQLIKNAPVALGVLKRRGTWNPAENGGVEWWVPGKFVLSLEVAALQPSRLPVEHAASEIAPTGAKDPFLYNPRIKALAAGKTILVANEQIDVFVTLSNPFAFDLEVSDLTLLTEGTPFLANPLPLLLPANSVQTIRITGTCSSSGTLSIKGVSIRLPDGARAEVYLPVIDAKARERKDKVKSRLAVESGKMKRYGAEARLALHASSSKRDSQGSSSTKGSGSEGGGALEEGESWLECVVVPDQPLLWVKRSSLTHGTMMLYDGERSTLALTLENSSSTPVNFIKLSFDDNTVREAQSALSDELGPRDAYEIQFDQLERPVMRWNTQKVNIPPGGRASVVIECLGKVGCTDGSIRIDYGHVQSTESGAAASFYTRSITFPILFTVYHTLEPHDLEIFRFPASSASASVSALAARPSVASPTGDLGSKALQTPQKKRPIPSRPPLTPRSSSFALDDTRHDALREAMENQADDDHCMLALSVRNVYGVPFEVCLSRTIEGETTVNANRLVPPGATERLVLPLPRLALPPSDVETPIPTLGFRQYVVDKTGRSTFEIGKERELFWYRERLLDMLRLSYVEPGSRREGELNLRRVRVEPSILRSFKKDEVEISISLDLSTGTSARVGDFGDVVLRINNKLDRPIIPAVRIEPLPMTSRRHPSDGGLRHVVFDGTLSTNLEPVPPGGEGKHVVGVMFLVEGSFAFRAHVEHVPKQEGEEARVWTSDKLEIDVTAHT